MEDNYYGDYSGAGNFTSGQEECASRTSIATPILYLIIATIGLIANGIVVYIIVILKEYQKTVTNVYVLQLAIADFMFLLVLPFEAKVLIDGKWNFGVAFCKIFESIRMLNYYSSILFLTIMSMDRYIAIAHAMDSRFTRFRTRKSVYLISAILWLLAFLGVVFVLIYATVQDCDCQLVFGVAEKDESIDDYTYEADGLETSGQDMTSFNYSGVHPTAFSQDYYLNIVNNAPGGCSSKKHYELNLWIVCNFLLAFLIPLIIICGCYAQIVRKIYEPMSVGTRSQKSNKTRKRVTRMVTSLVTVFIICWLPFHSFLLSRSAGSILSLNQCRIVGEFTHVFAYLSSTLNPFLYTFLGTNFRKRWKTAVIRTRSFRPSIGSRSGADYAHGRKARRKSSGVSMSGHKERDDTNSHSLVTKHTVVPTNNILLQDQDEIKL